MNIMWNQWLQNLSKPGCQIAAPLLAKHLHAPHTLTPKERARLDAHLAACDSCLAEADTVRAVEKLLRERGRAALPPAIPAADLWDRIEGRIIAEQSARRRVAPLRPVLLFAPVLAAVAVTVVLLPQSKTGAPVAETEAAKSGATGSVARNTDVPAQKAIMSVAARVAPVATETESEPPRVAMNVAQTLPRQTAPPAAASSLQSRSQPVSKLVTARSRVADYAVGTMVPAPRETRPETKVDRAIMPAKRNPVLVARAAPSAVMPTVGIAEAKVLPTSPHALAAAPTLAAPAPTYSNNKTIKIVDSNAGTGVPDTASPVTDTLIRQRQKRGLFGGYGATLAVVPTGSDTAP